MDTCPKKTHAAMPGIAFLVLLFTSVSWPQTRPEDRSIRGLHVVEPVPNGRRLFAPRCFDPELPNVGAIGWVGETSEKLAIAVQVPPHSSCASMGTFKAFVIRLPSGAVVSEYGQLEAKKMFSDRLVSCL
jgi:hypothetical protein